MLRDVQLALRGFIYQGLPQFNGEDTVHITVSDVSVTSGISASQPLTTSGEFFVAVTPVNDAPVLAVPTRVVTVEDEAVGIEGLYVVDADIMVCAASYGSRMVYGVAAVYVVLRGAAGFCVVYHSMRCGVTAVRLLSLLCVYSL